MHRKLIYTAVFAMASGMRQTDAREVGDRRRNGIRFEPVTASRTDRSDRSGTVGMEGMVGGSRGRSESGEDGREDRGLCGRGRCQEDS